jgi:hypothetical protein
MTALIKLLPKYKKTITKEFALKSISQRDGGVYLVVLNSDPVRHHGEKTVKTLAQWPNNLYPAQGVYFFELFKYMVKYNNLMNYGLHNRRLEQLDKKEIKREIKKHLLKKQSRKLTNKKLNLLVDYSKFVDYCFDNLLSQRDTQISLVIQKKIGYRWYQNIVYT